MDVIADKLMLSYIFCELFLCTCVTNGGNNVSALFVALRLRPSLAVSFVAPTAFRPELMPIISGIW